MEIDGIENMKDANATRHLTGQGESQKAAGREGFCALWRRIKSNWSIFKGEGEPYRKSIAAGKSFIGERSCKTREQTDPVSPGLNRFEGVPVRPIALRRDCHRGKRRCVVVDRERENARRDGSLYRNRVARLAEITVQNDVRQSFFNAELYGKQGFLFEADPICQGLDPRLDATQLREPAVQFKPVLRIIHRTSSPAQHGVDEP